LALQHAQAQEEVAAQLVQRLTPLWNILDPEDLDEEGDSAVAWLTAVVPVVLSSYYASQRLGQVFAQDMRWAALPTAEPLPLRPVAADRPLDLPFGAFDQIDLEFDDDEVWDMRPFDVEEVAKSMYMNGPARVKANMGEKTLDEAMATADVVSKGAAIRQAVNGSRAVTRQVSEDDKRALGWARVTDNDPCYYCAILASRGAVYQADSFVAKDASFANPSEPVELGDNWTDVAKVHDNCRCTLRPVFMKNQFRDREAWFYFEQWKQFSKGKSNKAAIREFRKKFVHYPRGSSKLVNLEDIRDRKRSLRQAGFDEDSPQVRWTERMDRRILRAA
jgi:hypothetical protein